MRYSYVEVEDGFRIEATDLDFNRITEIKFLYHEKGWSVSQVEDLIELLNLVGNE
jgi:hypothetical protein